MKAVLITGNPKYINNEIARKYYADIVQFLQSNGVDVTIDPGADYTCPPKADFYIGHSRGAGRIRCFERTDQFNDFLRFGDIGGYIHPVDEAWQNANPPNPNKFNPPPKEHFEFTSEQQQAILEKMYEIRQREQSTRQHPGMGRPRPRG
ncbi:hypothetical protein [Pseudomonas phage D6]|nr:hypothetical protein [Pseudomonas phage D6]